MKNDQNKMNKNSKLESLIKNDFLSYSSQEDYKANLFQNQTNQNDNQQRKNSLSIINTNQTGFDLNQIRAANESPKFDLFSSLIDYFHPDRTRSERERLFISFLSNLFYALANLMIKFISRLYPSAQASTTSLYRFVVMFLLSYLYIINRKITFLELAQVKSKITLAVRILTAYAISVSLANSVHYLRLGTAVSFFFVTPIFTSLASIYFFNDKCKTRNVIGLIVCILSMIMITNSESKAEEENPNLNLGLGFLWGTSSLISTVAMIISTKMLVYEIDSNNLNYLIGKFSVLIGFVICVLNGSLLYLHLGYVLLTSLNGFFFWCALYFMNISLKINNLIAVSCIGFLTLVYAFGFGFIFFGENLRFIDVIASLIIFGFNIYSILFPIPQENLSNVNNNNTNNNNDANRNNNNNQIHKNLNSDFNASHSNLVDKHIDKRDVERLGVNIIKNST